VYVIALLMQRVAAYSAVVILLSGCTAPLTQLGALGSMQNRAPTTYPLHRPLPQSSSGQDLLYVSGIDAVGVYSYPKGKSLGLLGTFESPGGMCVDRSGNAFVPIYYDGQVLEFAHGDAAFAGSTPIATIATANFPRDCSIDPTTGDLAVTFWDGVQIFSNGSTGWRGPQTYTQPDGTYFVYSCAYDNSGNLFFDADTQHSPFQLTELLAGGSGTFTTVSLNQGFKSPAGILWDGTYLAVADWRRRHWTQVYRFSIQGSTGTEVGSTKLVGGKGTLFWIQGSTIISPGSDRGEYGVGFWKYPEGGRPKKIVSFHDGAAGVAVSPGG